jgi:hypothetical protein
MAASSDAADAALDCEGALVPDDDARRRMWLKGCLVFDACAKGARPFVSCVMEKVLFHALKAVKDDVARSAGECGVEDWDCSTCTDAADPKFTDEGPVSLSICAVDANGVFDGGAPHCLKPRTFRPCRLRSVPVGSFSNSDADLHSVPLVMCPNPLDMEDPKSSRFLVLRDMKLDSSKHVLKPFAVSRCEPLAPALDFHAVLCYSRPGRTAELVASGVPHPASAADDAVFSFRFWSLTRSGTLFAELRHGMKQGQIVRFTGDVSDSGLPLWVVRGCRYAVREPTPFSFNICGPIVCPLAQLAFGSDSGLDPPHLMITSPVGR